MKEGKGNLQQHDRKLTKAIRFAESVELSAMIFTISKELRNMHDTFPIATSLENYYYHEVEWDAGPSLPDACIKVLQRYLLSGGYERIL